MAGSGRKENMPMVKRALHANPAILLADKPGFWESVIDTSAQVQ
jgi:hypothetical protein